MLEKRGEGNKDVFATGHIARVNRQSAMCKQRGTGRAAPTDLLLPVESTGSHQVGSRGKVTVNQGKSKYIASCAEAGCL